MSDFYGLTREQIAAALGGDKEAFCDLIEASEHDLAAFIRSRAKSRPVDIADLKNDTYLRVWSKRSKTTPEQVRTAIHQSALVVLEAHQRQARRLELARRVFPWVAKKGPGGSGSGREDIDHMLRALPPDIAVAVELKHVHGLDMRQVAERMGVAAYEVQNWLAAGRAFLRERGHAEAWDRGRE